MPPVPCAGLGWYYAGAASRTSGRRSGTASTITTISTTASAASPMEKIVAAIWFAGIGPMMMKAMTFKICPARIVHDATSWFRRPTTPAVNPMMVWGHDRGALVRRRPGPQEHSVQCGSNQPGQSTPDRSEKDTGDDDHHHMMARIAPPPTIGFGIR